MSTVKSKKLQVGTDATSTNNFTIAQPSSPNGSIEIGQGNADDYTKVGEFNANGYKPQEPVAFSAYANANLSVSNNTITKLLFQTKRFDTNSNYNASTSKFTPTVAGYYQITGTTHMSSLGSTSAQLWCAIYKNGINWHYGNINHSQQVNVSPMVTGLVYLNGSTDYIEIYCRQSSGATAQSGGGATVTWIEGILIAQA